MDRDTVLIILGVILVLTGIAGRIETNYFNVGIESKSARFFVGLLGVIFILCHFQAPKNLIISLLPSKPTLVIKPFKVTTSNEMAKELTMKVEKNLVEFYSLGGSQVKSNRIIESTKNSKSKPFHLNGQVYESDGKATIDVTVYSPNGDHISTASIKGNLFELYSKYKVLPDALAYGLDIDNTTLKKRKQRKRPTASIEAYAEYKWAVKKYREKAKEESITSLKKAIEFDKTFAMAYWTGSEILKEIGNNTKAKSWSAMALEIDKDHLHWSFVPEDKIEDPVPHLLKELKKAKEKNISEGFVVKEIYSKPFDLNIFAARIDLKHFQFKVIEQYSINGNSTKEYITRENAVLAINGGMFGSDYEQRLSPVGLLKIEGVLLQAKDNNFSGSFVVGKNGRPNVIATKHLISIDDYKFGLQSRPLLVDPGGRFGMRKRDYNRMDRSAVCMSKGKILFVVVKGNKGVGLSLYEFAKLLHSQSANGGFGCDIALNLDGGPSSQLSISIENYEKAIPGFWKVQNAILVFPK